MEDSVMKIGMLNAFIAALCDYINDLLLCSYFHVSISEQTPLCLSNIFQ